MFQSRIWVDGYSTPPLLNEYCYKPSSRQLTPLRPSAWICHILILALFCRSHNIDGLVSFWGYTWHTISGCRHRYHWVGYDPQPCHRDHWFHQTGWLEKDFVGVRSSLHSVESLCSRYLWNQQMEDSGPVIGDGWSSFEMKGCSMSFLISSSEIVHIFQRDVTLMRDDTY